MEPEHDFRSLVIRAFLTLAVSLNFNLNQVKSENILFFYGGGTYSHKHTIWPLASALGDKGHNVTFLSPHSKSSWSHPNVTDVIPPKLEKLLSVFHVRDKLEMRLAGEEKFVWNTLSEWSLNICKTVLEDKDNPILNSILYDDNVKFDLVMINACFGECGYILAERWGAKVILIDSTSILPYFYDTLGMTSVAETSWIPDITSQFLYPMSYWNKIRNFFYSLHFNFDRIRVLYPELEKIRKKYLKNAKQIQGPYSFQQLERESTSLVLLNTHFSTDYARSLPPNFIHIGGLHIWERRSEQIPQNIQEFMNESIDGAILMVFGTSYDISKTGRNYLNVFFQAMKTFPNINFVVNWEGSIPADIPQNILLSKWMPQKEILAHPKMKAFISHCGLYSIAEATYHGVPIIGLPLVADEDYDAYRIEMEEIGVRLEVKSLTTRNLIEAIQSILTDPKYHKNMKHISKLTRDRQVNPLENGVWWTEFVLRHDPVEMKALRPRTENLSWYQLRSLDVHALLFTSIGGCTVLILKVVNIFIAKLVK